MIKGVSLFSNVGIGEMNLKKCGIDIVVANELENEVMWKFNSCYSFRKCV